MRNIVVVSKESDLLQVCFASATFSDWGSWIHHECDGNVTD